MVVILISYTAAVGKVSPQEFIRQVQKALPVEYGAYIYIVSNNDTFDFETQKAKIEKILVEDETGKRIVVIPNEKISAFKECFKNINFEEETIPSNVYQQVEKSVQESCDGVHVTLGTIEIGKIQEPVSPEIPTLKIPITPKSNSQKWIYSGMALIAVLVVANIFITLYGFKNTETLLDSTCFEKELQELRELREIKETQGQQIKELKKEQLFPSSNGPTISPGPTRGDETIIIRDQQCHPKYRVVKTGEGYGDIAEKCFHGNRTCWTSIAEKTPDISWNNIRRIETILDLPEQIIKEECIDLKGPTFGILIKLAKRCGNPLYWRDFYKLNDDIIDDKTILDNSMEKHLNIPKICQK